MLAICLIVHFIRQICSHDSITFVSGSCYTRQLVLTMKDDTHVDRIQLKGEKNNNQSLKCNNILPRNLKKNTH